MSSSDSDSDNGFTIKNNLTKSLSKGLEKFKLIYKVDSNNTETDSEDESVFKESPKKNQEHTGSVTPEDDLLIVPIVKEVPPLHISQSSISADDDLPIALRKKRRTACKKNVRNPRKSVNNQKHAITKVEQEPLEIIESPINLEHKIISLQAECSNFIQEMNYTKNSGRSKKCKVARNQTKITNHFKQNKSKKNDSPINLSDDEIVITPEDLNPIVSVNLLWKSTENKIFKVRKFDNLESIHNYFINELNINPKLLLFTIGETEIDLKANNYASLRLDQNIIIEGGVLPDTYLDKDTANIKKKKEGIRFIVQHDSHRNQRFNIFLNPGDKLDMAYSQVIQEIGLTVDKFKLSFDGLIIKHSDTISSLDIEEGDILDVLLI